MKTLVMFLLLFLLKVFEGNDDDHTIISDPLPEPIIARFIKITVMDYHKGVRLRCAILGCDLYLRK